MWTVENGELVGRTDGLAKNERIVSDLAVDDLTLTLGVRLIDNRGNSDIQFRSHAQDGEVAGYQADVGVGWWGKLYEEHGRGLLWEKSGEPNVNRVSGIDIKSSLPVAAFAPISTGSSVSTSTTSKVQK